MALCGKCSATAPDSMTNADMRISAAERGDMNKRKTIISKATRAMKQEDDHLSMVIMCCVIQ